MGLKTKQRTSPNIAKIYQGGYRLLVVIVMYKAMGEAPNAAFCEVEIVHEIGQFYSGCSETYSGRC